MTLEEIRKNAPSKATHYYKRFGSVLYVRHLFHNQYEVYYLEDVIIRKFKLSERLLFKPL